MISVEENLGKNKTYRLITPEFEHEFKTKDSKLRTSNPKASEEVSEVKKATPKKNEGEGKAKTPSKKKEIPKVDLTTGETPKSTPKKSKKKSDQSKAPSVVPPPQEATPTKDVVMIDVMTTPTDSAKEPEKQTPKKRQRKSDDNSKKTKRVKAVDKSALQIHLDSIDVDSPSDPKKTRVVVTSVGKLKEQQKQQEEVRELSDLPMDIENLFKNYSVEKASTSDPVSLNPSPIKLSNPILAECIKAIMRVPLSEYNPDIAKRALENFSDTEISDCFYELKKMNVIVKVKGQSNTVGLRGYKLSNRYQQALHCPLGENLYDEGSALWNELQSTEGSPIHESRSTYAIESGGRVATALALLAHGMVTSFIYLGITA